MLKECEGRSPSYMSGAHEVREHLQLLMMWHCRRTLTVEDKHLIERSIELAYEHMALLRGCTCDRKGGKED